MIVVQDRPPTFKGHPAVVFLHITLLMMDSFDQVLIFFFVSTVKLVEMEKVGDTGDISLLFLDALASLKSILFTHSLSE